MSDIVERLREIAKSISAWNLADLTMRIPAEPDRDADLVVMRAAGEIESLREQVAELEGSLIQCGKNGLEWRTKLVAMTQDNERLMADVQQLCKEAEAHDDQIAAMTQDALIESLREQVAELATCHESSKVRAQIATEQLAASQAREQQRIEAFKLLQRYLSPKHVTEHAVVEKALALPSEGDTALKQQNAKLLRDAARNYPSGELEGWHDISIYLNNLADEVMKGRT